MTESIPPLDPAEVEHMALRMVTPELKMAVVRLFVADAALHPSFLYDAAADEAVTHAAMDEKDECLQALLAVDPLVAFKAMTVFVQMLLPLAAAASFKRMPAADPATVLRFLQVISQAMQGDSGVNDD